MFISLRRLVFCCLLLPLAAHAAPVQVIDDVGNTVTLPQPARRIVTLAPSLTEIAYAAGAGHKIVAAVDYSDYPPAAARLPRLGNYAKLDLEALSAAKPDLVLAWQSGNAPAALDKIRQLGIAVYVSQPDKIGEIADSIERIGTLAGTAPVAHKAAQAFRQRYAALRQRYQGLPTVRLFYQISSNPLLTVGGQQFISDAIHACGGENIFAALKPLAPRINAEAVIAADPEAIFTSGMQNLSPDLLDAWKAWPQLTATQRGNFFFLNPDWMNRGGPRILDGTQALCEALQTVRRRRPKPH